MASAPRTNAVPLLPAPPAGYARRMPPQVEARELVAAGRDVFGRELRLVAGAASAWHAMREAAESDGVRLLALSGFRSVARQREIVAAKLAKGVAWEEILRVSAYPGHSEHHTGRALDLGVSESAPFTEAFATTGAFQWLCTRAAAFGFVQTYPRDNGAGIAHEPWHWCWHPSPAR